MIYAFEGSTTFNQEVVIDDPGNTCIKCSNGSGEDYYLLIRTIMGTSYLLSMGPVISDLPELQSGFSISHTIHKYNEKFIDITIQKFINDYRKGINSVMEVSDTMLWEAIPDFKRVFGN